MMNIAYFLVMISLVSKSNHNKMNDFYRFKNCEETEHVDTCTYCLETVEGLQEFFSDEAMVELIMDLMKDICGDFPYPFDKSCRRYVDEYVPEMFERFCDMSSLEVCEKLYLCT